MLVGASISFIYLNWRLAAIDSFKEYLYDSKQYDQGDLISAPRLKDVSPPEICIYMLQKGLDQHSPL